jgi:AcrR family transcriptional regulator
VQAAMALFAERGYEGTTTRAIGERASCSEALIQNYFGGKEGLLLAVMRSGAEWDSYTAFFNRPLCLSIEQEAFEHLTYVIEGLRERTAFLRIVLSRAMVDASFQSRVRQLTLRRRIAAEVTRRFERYRQAELLDEAAPLSSAVQGLVDMGFQLGFVHPQLDGDPVQVPTLTRDFARLFARAVQPQKRPTRKGCP